MSRYSSAASAGGRATAEIRRRSAERRLQEAPLDFLKSMANWTWRGLPDLDDVRYRTAAACAYVAAVRWGRPLARERSHPEALSEVERIDGGADLPAHWASHDPPAEKLARRVLRRADWTAVCAAVLLDGWRAAYTMLHDVGRGRPRL